ncbi:uncharacterized protein FTOL_13969 [Fusarium torulosum]|uniref:Uncharacterized protein n=1 Tax=Fusarium torulosum TaxID=33205 RepID=A0AAE8SQQ8_9HYPO|nr:uncharacterized protein FTOL_13969 [Fusarium torulosum]
MPDALVLYYLKDFQPEDSILEKRRNIRVCERILAARLVYIIIRGAIKGAIL